MNNPRNADLAKRFQLISEWKENSKVVLKSAQRFGDALNAFSGEGDVLTEELLKIQKLTVQGNAGNNNNNSNNSPAIGSSESDSEDIAKEVEEGSLIESSIMSLRNMIKSFVITQKQMLNVLTENFEIQPNSDIEQLSQAAQENKKKLEKARQDYADSRTKSQEAFKRGKTMDETTVLALSKELQRLDELVASSRAAFDQNLRDLALARQQRSLRFITYLTQLQNSFYEQGLGIVSTITPQLESISKKVEEEEKISTEQGDKEGWLFKRGGSNTWHRYYFSLKNGMLYYQRGSPQDIRSFSVVLCTVKQNQSPSSTEFEIITPTKKKPIVLYAETESDRRQWIEAVQRAILTSLSSQRLETVAESSSPSTSATTSPMNGSGGIERLRSGSGLSGDVLQILKGIPGNAVCSDCSSKDPTWGSVNLGILLCLECSGVHRALGTHISKVRSTTLDKWEPETLMLMQSIGNNTSNLFFEQNGCTMPRPQAHSDRETREKFIQAKYVSKEFANKVHSFTPPSIVTRRLYSYCQSGNSISDTLELVVSGGDINWVHPESGYTPLIAAAVGNCLIHVEMLILNGANLIAQDSNGWTCLHHAAQNNLLQMVSLILRRKGPHPILTMTNNANQTPLDLAVSSNSLEAAAFIKNFQDLEAAWVERRGSGNYTRSAFVSINSPSINHTPNNNTNNNTNNNSNNSNSNSNSSNNSSNSNSNNNTPTSRSLSPPTTSILQNNVPRVRSISPLSSLTSEESK